MNTNTILGLVAQTPIHAGASSSEEAVDLPIQREGHTDWPVVFGSGVKGALRAHFETLLPEGDIFSLFGPDTTNGSEHAGALMVGDAQILLLPVRSLTTHVKWVTCPAVLQRANQSAKRMLGASVDLCALSAVSESNALCEKAQSKELYLEEFKYHVEQGDLSQVHELVNQIIGDNFTKIIKENIVVLCDDQFRYMCRNAIPIQAHIAIDSSTKTVKDGALWYEENLPSESVMYVCVACSNDRRSDQSSVSLLSKISDEFNVKPYLQIGGNMTTGMGWFEVNCAGHNND